MKNKIIMIAIAMLAIVAIILLTRNTAINKGIQPGDQVTIQYQATLPDGRIFQSGEQTIVIGENSIPGLDTYVVGLQTGDQKTITVAASESYGQFYNPSLIQRLPIYTLTQAEINPEAETFILFGGNRYYIQKIENDIATLDGNPAHTRQNLTYEITILNIQNQKENE